MSTALLVEQLGDATSEITMGSKGTTGQLIVKYRVYFSDSAATPYAATIATTIANGSIPAYWSTIGPYVLTSKKGKQISTEGRDDFFEVECTYTIPQPTDLQPRPDENTDRWAVKISGRPATYETPTQFNAYGKAILNVVGDPIEGITRRQADEAITIEFTCSVIDFTSIRACIDHVNDEDITLTINGVQETYPTNTLLFSDYSWTAVKDPSGTDYPRLTYSLLNRPDGWTKYVANKGYRKLVGGVPTPILDALGNPITQPVYLNSDGTAELAAGADVVKIAVAEFHTGNLTALLADLGT